MATATRFVKILKEVINASAAVGSFLTATSTNAMVTMKNKLPQYLYLELNTFIGKKKKKKIGIWATKALQYHYPMRNQN